MNVLGVCSMNVGNMYWRLYVVKVMLIVFRISPILRMDYYEWLLPSHAPSTQPILLRYCGVFVSRSQTVRANVVAHLLRRTFLYDHLHCQIPFLIVLRVERVSARVMFPLDPIDITPIQLFIARGAEAYVGATESVHDINPSEGLLTPPV